MSRSRRHSHILSKGTWLNVLLADEGAKAMEEQQQWEVTIEDQDDDAWWEERVSAKEPDEAKQRALTSIREHHPEVRDHNLVITTVRQIWRL